MSASVHPAPRSPTTGRVDRARPIAGTALAVVASLTWTGCTRGDAAERASPAGGGPMSVPVEVVTLADVPIQDSSNYLAQLVSRTQVAIYPQVSGVVTSVFVKPGQAVREGAPLLQIDPRRESANLSNQVAARAQREANFALAKRNASRSAALFREGLISRQQLEQDQSQATVAEAEVNAQTAVIGAQAAQLGYYRIAAPFDGAVGDISWKSPVGRALLGKSVGDSVVVRWHAGTRNLTVAEILYR